MVHEVSARTACFALMAVLLAACGGEDAPSTGTTAGKDASADSQGDAAVVAAVDAASDSSADVAQDPCPGGEGCLCEDDAGCDDKNPCTTNGNCQEGACSAPTAVVCDDGNQCTEDFCLPSGACSSKPAPSWCSDGNPCTTGDLCKDGGCLPGVAKDCGDGNPCTDDSCVVGQGCQYVDNASECIAENACAETSYCSLGGCEQGKAKPCDDNNPCTWNSCDPISGCHYLGVPDAATCTDGELFGGRCWKAMKQDVNWNQAREACHAWGGELASMRNAADNSAVRKAADQVCGQVPALFGLNDIAIEGKYRWADGENSNYANFHTGEPNNAGNEDVFEIYVDGTWNDLAEGATLACAVCSRWVIYACDDGEPCTAPTVCQGGSCLPATVTPSCDDGNGCTLDGCAVGLGCGHTPSDDGSLCGGSGVCTSGYCVLPASEATPSSCAELAQDATSGVYWLDLDGPGAATPTQVYCDTQGDGGGWSLVLEVDGSQADSAYDSPLWIGTSPELTAPPWPSKISARLKGYATIPVKDVRLVFEVDGVPRSLVIAGGAKGSTLQQLLNGPKVSTSLSVLDWEGLLPKGTLQGNCLEQGFQVEASGVKLRLGIFGNNENDCSSVDSWLGIGSSGGPCGVDTPPGAGNVACWGGDHGGAKTAAMVYVYVR